MELIEERAKEREKEKEREKAAAVEKEAMTSCDSPTSWLVNVDFKGGDLPKNALNTDLTSAMDCCKKCRDMVDSPQDGACVAWTFVEVTSPPHHATPITHSHF